MAVSQEICAPLCAAQLGIPSRMGPNGNDGSDLALHELLCGAAAVAARSRIQRTGGDEQGIL